MQPPIYPPDSVAPEKVVKELLVLSRKREGDALETNSIENDSIVK